MYLHLDCTAFLHASYLISDYIDAVVPCLCLLTDVIARTETTLAFIQYNAIQYRYPETEEIDLPLHEAGPKDMPPIAFTYVRYIYT